MKKKDLKVGVVYANKRGRAYLLINTQMWQFNRYYESWRVSRFDTPARGHGYMSSGRGVLCLSGDVWALRKWALEHSELLNYDASSSSEADNAEFNERLRESLPAESNFCIAEQDYRHWPGTYENVRAKLDKEQQLKGAERDKLRARAREYKDRAEVISKALNERGVELAWGKRTIDTLQGEHGQSVGYHSGYKLDLDDLEKILGIEAETNRGQQGTFNGGTFINNNKEN